MPEPTPFPVNAAKFSWMAPIGAIALRIIYVVVAAGNANQETAPDPQTGMIFSYISAAIVLAGLVAGVIALFGIKKYGAKGIAIPAAIGIAINLFLIVTAFMAVSAARQALQSQTAAAFSPSATVSDTADKSGMTPPFYSSPNTTRLNSGRS